MLLLFTKMSISENKRNVNNKKQERETQMNEIIRVTAKNKGVKLWEIAEVLGINDGNFSRKLRRELPDQEKQHILGIIDAISEREGQ